MRILSLFSYGIADQLFLYLVNTKRFLNEMMDCRVSSIIPLGVHGTGISRKVS